MTRIVDTTWFAYGHGVCVGAVVGNRMADIIGELATSALVLALALCIVWRERRLRGAR